MDIDLKALRCFVMLADELNFSRAAERLHLTQPALSSQIRVLETRLALPLFIRTTRRVSLSESGTALLSAARRFVDESHTLQRAIADLQGKPRRKLGFGAAFYTIDIPERVRLLEAFFAAHPMVALDVIPAWQRDLVADLQNDRVDLALVIGLPVSRTQLAREVEIEPDVEILYPDDLPRMVLRREPVGLRLQPGRDAMPIDKDRDIAEARVAQSLFDHRRTRGTFINDCYPQFMFPAASQHKALWRKRYGAIRKSSN